MKKIIFTILSFILLIPIVSASPLPDEVGVTADAVVVVNLQTDDIIYEKNLDKVAKEYNFTDEKNIEIKAENVVEFINEMLFQYENYSSYEHDLRYACYVCNTIMNMIIDNIIENEYKIRIASSL